ncbi:MAG: PorT family protein [Bacteroidetes bacterium]|nr:PorT family protein [Bacteroidota bacterium]
MKRFLKVKYFLFVGLLMFSLNGKSQDLRFGITANPGMIWVSSDNKDVSGDGVRFAFDFGLVVDYVFGAEERYAFNTGLNLSVSGAKLKGVEESTGLSSTVTARVNYLQLPLTIKLRSNEVGYFTFYGQLGIMNSFAFRSRADYEIERDSGGGKTTETGENVKFENIPFYPNMLEKVKPYNLGLYVEAGLEYDITENTVLVGGPFFNTGFLDMFKDSNNDRVVSRQFGFRIGVLF